MTNLEKYKDKFIEELSKNHPFCSITIKLRTGGKKGCDNCDCIDCQMKSLKWLAQEYTEPKKEFTQEELTILKNIDNKWKWITRNKNKGLWVHTKKPTKAHSYWASNDTAHETMLFNCFNQIQFEDSEPVFIDDYVDRKGD